MIPEYLKPRAVLRRGPKLTDEQKLQRSRENGLAVFLVILFVLFCWWLTWPVWVVIVR